jgi:tetratricopeptide (TPR) repeat protein
MADKKSSQEFDGEVIIEKAKDFWTKFSKPLMIVSTVIILAVGGWYGYQNFVKKPKEAKAVEAMFKAQEYFGLDSMNLALNGDGQYDGFIKIINKFGGTDAANSAHYYAGVCYIKLNDNENAIKHLKKFSTGAKAVQARAYKLLGDAYADLGKNADALSYYKKAARHFEEDDANAAEYLLYAAYLADRTIKDPKEATALYKEIKEKFPKSSQATDADNYLAQMGVYNVN